MFNFCKSRSHLKSQACRSYMLQGNFLLDFWAVDYWVRNTHTLNVFGKHLARHFLTQTLINAWFRSVQKSESRMLVCFSTAWNRGLDIKRPSLSTGSELFFKRLIDCWLSQWSDGYSPRGTACEHWPVPSFEKALRQRHKVISGTGLETLSRALRTSEGDGARVT